MQQTKLKRDMKRGIMFEPNEKTGTGQNSTKQEHQQTYFRLNKELMTQSFGEWYVPADKISQIAAGPELKPVYFASMRWREIFHDDPVPGAMQYGEVVKFLDGPFVSEADARTAAENKKSEFNTSRYDFSASVLTKFYPANDFPPKLEALCCEQYSIEAWMGEWGSRMLGECCEDGAPELYDHVVEAMPKFYDALCKQLIDLSSEHRQEEGGFKELTAVVHNTLIEARIIHYEKKKSGNVKIRALYQEADKTAGKTIELMAPIVGTLEEFNIPTYAMLRSLWGRYLALPPVSKFSAEQRIDKYIEINKNNIVR